MIRILVVLGLAYALFSFVGDLRASSQWLTDYDQAIAMSKETGKPIFANFTGSDWCIWCKRLQNEVFSKADFKNFANEKLVLLELDFPRKQQSAELQKQNKALAQKYGIEGFPTILILNEKGSVVAKTGYRRGGAGPYVDHLRSIIK